MSGQSAAAREEFCAVALCAAGAEKTLANELKKLASQTTIAFSIAESSFGKVRFTTDKRGLYHALIGLRTADRILLQCARYNARNFDELFEGARAAPLERFIPRDMPLVIEKVRTNRSSLAAETSIQAVTHKAAAGRLCEKYGLRRLPEGPCGASLRVYLEKDQAELLMDLCGAPLHKRGYRLEGGAAPLRETAAAAILLTAGWKRKFPLYDPFCGSGTLLIEAALYAFDIAPGLERHFTLEKFLIADKQIEEEARNYFLSRIDFSRIVRITGSDYDNNLVNMAKRNAERALQRGNKESPARLTFNTLNAEAARSFDENGYIITNPPYGTRLGDKESARKNYERMSILRDHFSGWKLVVISDDPGFESFFGSTAEHCRELVCGAVKLYEYEFKAQQKNSAHPGIIQKPQKKESLKQVPKNDYHWTW